MKVILQLDISLSIQRPSELAQTPSLIMGRQKICEVINDIKVDNDF